jgi:YHS domain-containing protein
MRSSLAAAAGTRLDAGWAAAEKCFSGIPQGGHRQSPAKGINLGSENNHASLVTREEDEMLDCPVCAKPVDRETAATSVYEGITYYLRCPRCKERFDAEPKRFLRSGAGADHAGCGEHAHADHGAGGPRR